MLKNLVYQRLHSLNKFKGQTLVCFAHFIHDFFGTRRAIPINVQQCKSIHSDSANCSMFCKYVFSLGNVEKDRSPIHVDTGELTKWLTM